MDFVRARNVAARLAAMPRPAARVALARRAAVVGPARFTAEMGMLSRAVGGGTPAPGRTRPANPDDPAYRAVVRQSGLGR